MKGRLNSDMMYSETDIRSIRTQMIRRIAFTLLLALLPNIAAGVVMATVRIQWLSVALGMLGGALAVLYWGMSVSPVWSYYRYLREVVGGRTHEFTGELTEIAQDSVREGVRCKTLFFSDDAGDDQRLCYFDLNKYPQEGCGVNRRYLVTVHGQSIVAIQPE